MPTFVKRIGSVSTGAVTFKNAADTLQIGAVTDSGNWTIGAALSSLNTCSGRLSIESTSVNPLVVRDNTVGNNDSYLAVRANTSYWRIASDKNGTGTQRGISFGIDTTENTTSTSTFGFVDTTGVWYKSGGGSWTTYASDERLKQNIIPIVDGLSVVTMLNPVHFAWRNADEHSADPTTGFIAQQVELVKPEWTQQGRAFGADEALLPEGEKPKTVGFDQSFDAYLVAAIKELKKKNDELEARIAALEGV